MLPSSNFDLTAVVSAEPSSERGAECGRVGLWTAAVGVASIVLFFTTFAMLCLRPDLGGTSTL